MKVYVLLEVAGDCTEVIGVYSNEYDAIDAEIDYKVNMEYHGIAINELKIIESELKLK